MDWAEKYRPQHVGEIVGQKKALEEITKFLDSERGSKALLLHGPPGVGKSLSIEVLAQERCLDLLRINASDERTSNDIESLLMDSSRTKPLFSKGKIILFEEVDGISSQDRGAVNSIIKIIKNSMFPVVLIANDPWLPKLMPLRTYCSLVKFNKINYLSIEKRLRGICKEDGIGVGGDVLKDLARWSQGDMRSAISDLQVVTHDGKVGPKDLEVLGYRERRLGVFDVLPTLFKSRSIKASKKALYGIDKDPDEVFLWVEMNAAKEIVREKLPEAYDLLSRADLFRKLVSKQQNWRFKGYMVDLISGISVVKGETHAPGGFSPYQPPERIKRLGRTRAKRAVRDSLTGKISGITHCSKKTVIRDYLPFLKIISKGKVGMINNIELDPRESELLAD